MELPSLALDAQKYATQIKLFYCSGQEVGFTRKRKGKGFAYYDEQNQPIIDPAVKQRIQNLIIPPAWTEVWISNRDDTHIQATGRDDKGRKQYIYHSAWHEMRNLSKFESLLEFAQALPTIRQHVESDLRKQKLTHQKVVAIVTYMLDKTLIRIGNSQYVANNGSFGLTTLRKRHVRVDNNGLTLNFVGKSGKKHALTLEDKRLSRLIKSCQELPGQNLFQYVDEEGKRQSVQSADINLYLQEITGCNFSAKYFRTWGGTVAAIETLLGVGPAASAKDCKQSIRSAIGQAAQALGNTRSVCRTYYVHPSVVTAYENGSLFALYDQEMQTEWDPEDDYSTAERVALALLQPVARQS